MLKYTGINLEIYKYFRLFNRIMFKLLNGKLEWETFNQWNVFIRSHDIHGIYSPEAIYSQNIFCRSVSRNYVFLSYIRVTLINFCQKHFVLISDIVHTKIGSDMSSNKTFKKKKIYFTTLTKKLTNNFSIIILMI